MRGPQLPTYCRSLTLRFENLYVFRKNIRKMPIFKGIFLSEKNFKLKISVDFLKVQSIFFPENFLSFWIISKLNAEKLSQKDEGFENFIIFMPWLVTSLWRNRNVIMGLIVKKYCSPRKYLSKALQVGFLIETKFVLNPPSLSLAPISKLPAKRVLLALG